MKPSELPDPRLLYLLTNRAVDQIRELWQYSGEDELPQDALLHAQIEAVRILDMRNQNGQRLAVRDGHLSASGRM